MTLAQLPPLPPHIRTLTPAEIEFLNARRPSTHQQPKRFCHTCGGSGGPGPDNTFLWYRDTTSFEVVEYECPCFDQYLLLRWMANCGIYDQYMRLGWRDLLNSDPEVDAAVFEYVKNREAYLARGIGLVFSGGRGNGKTMIANLLAKDLVAHGVDCYVTPMADLIDEFAEGWSDREISRWFRTRVRNAGVLVIDDLGRERKRMQKADKEGNTRVTSELVENTLEAVIRYRVGSNLPTILTTNLTEDEVAKGYGGHTMSLLQEKVIFVNVPGNDVRSAMQERTMAEIKAGIKQRPVVIA